MPSTVGFAGLGTMGEPLAIVLRNAGVDVVGFDVRSEVTDRLEREGGILAARSAVDLAERCPVVITMLPASADVEAFLFGSHSAAAALRGGSLVIDMTSGEPGITRRLGESLARSGVSMVDAPVSGNVVRARKGDLAIMLGGKPADCDRAEPGLAPLARAIYRTGPLGSGQAMKALNNLASAAGFWIAS
jgi:3-hydroxyisobutyrate dehydrogenase